MVALFQRIELDQDQSENPQEHVDGEDESWDQDEHQLVQQTAAPWIVRVGHAIEKEDGLEDTHCASD